MSAEISAEKPLVLLTIGTDHHKFDRIIGWIEEWHRANGAKAEVVVQHGHSRAPVGIEAHVRLPREELGQLMARARVIVTHGGGGSITQCWDAGRLPIVVPRVGKLGEHVDEHQDAFGSRLAEMGYATIARTYAELDAQLQEHLISDPVSVPTIDSSAHTETTRTIGRLIDDLVARKSPNRASRSRRSFRRT